MERQIAISLCLCAHREEQKGSEGKNTLHKREYRILKTESIANIDGEGVGIIVAIIAIGEDISQGNRVLARHLPIGAQNPAAFVERKAICQIVANLKGGERRDGTVSYVVRHSEA